METAHSSRHLTLGSSPANHHLRATSFSAKPTQSSFKFRTCKACFRSTGKWALQVSAQTKQQKERHSNSNLNLESSPHAYRLIIDRSILLLLSASKCCLRRGSEYLRGLEARQSIVGQIRASISIIMAIVKCSVFGAQVRSEEGTEAAQVEAENEGEVNFMLSAQQSALVWPSAGPKAPNSNPYSPPSQTFATDAPSTMSAPPSHANTTGAAPLTAVNFSRPQRDNKFDQQYLGRRSAPLAERQTVDGAQMFASRLERAKLAARRQDCWRQSQQFVGAHDEPSNDYNKTAPHRSSLASALQDGLPIAGKTRTSRNSPLQIMNYFLETWSGMQSAHDAINKLQVSPLRWPTFEVRSCGNNNWLHEEDFLVARLSKVNVDPFERWPNSHFLSLT